MKLFIAVVTLAAASATACAKEPNQPQTPTAQTALVRAMAGTPEQRRPLARLRSPLCLAVAASDGSFARTVATRIIDNAKTAGIPIRRAGCKPNALVTFSDDAHNQITQYRDEGGDVFRWMNDKEIDTALAARDPAYVFQSVQPTPRIGQGDGPALMGGAAENWTKERSILRTPEDMLSTLVVIEADAATGLTPIQVADYASMRLLAPTGEIAGDDKRASQTILSLFAAPMAAPPEMTKTDRAYLKSLYTLPRTAFAAEVIEKTVTIASR